MIVLFLVCTFDKLLKRNNIKTLVKTVDGFYIYFEALDESGYDFEYMDEQDKQIVVERLGICVVRLTTKIKIKYDTSLAYNTYTVLCTVNFGK